MAVRHQRARNPQSDPLTPHARHALCCLIRSVTLCTTFRLSSGQPWLVEGNSPEASSKVTAGCPISEHALKYAEDAWDDALARSLGISLALWALADRLSAAMPRHDMDDMGIVEDFSMPACCWCRSLWTPFLFPKQSNTPIKILNMIGSIFNPCPTQTNLHSRLSRFYRLCSISPSRKGKAFGSMIAQHSTSRALSSRAMRSVSGPKLTTCSARSHRTSRTQSCKVVASAAIAVDAEVRSADP